MKKAEPEGIKIVFVEAGKEPAIKTIANDLKTMQELVGGYIQVLAEALPYYVVFDEEAKPPYKNKKENRIINGHIVCGDLFITKINIETGEFKSLEEHEAEFFKQKSQTFLFNI